MVIYLIPLRWFLVIFLVNISFRFLHNWRFIVYSLIHFRWFLIYNTYEPILSAYFLLEELQVRLVLQDESYNVSNFYYSMNKWNYLKKRWYTIHFSHLSKKSTKNIIDYLIFWKDYVLFSSFINNIILNVNWSERICVQL